MKTYRIVVKKYDDGVITYTPQYCLNNLDKNTDDNWTDMVPPEGNPNPARRNPAEVNTEISARNTIKKYRTQHPFIIDERVIEVNQDEEKTEIEKAKEIIKRLREALLGNLQGLTEREIIDEANDFLISLNKR